MLLSHSLTQKTNNIIHEINITENEIIDVIQILDPNKATGPDK
jgi:hypothetical protein